MSFATGVEPCWKKEYSPTPAALGGCISEVWPRKESGGHPVTNWTVPLQPPDQFPAPTTAHCTTATRTMFGCCSQPPWASTLCQLKLVFSCGLQALVICLGLPLDVSHHSPLPPASSLFLRCLQAHSSLRTFTCAVSSAWNIIHSDLAFHVSAQITTSLYRDLTSPCFPPLHTCLCPICFLHRTQHNLQYFFIRL